GDQYIVQFGGSGSVGGLLSDTWLWVGFNAVATGFPNPTDVGINVSFGVSAVGGIKPYTYDWNYGDGTNSGAITTPPVHAYLTAGSYAPNVTVTDHPPRLPPDQTTANVTGNPIVVNPQLTVVATANPSVAVPGYTVELNSTPAGGTAAFTFVWVFGDGSVGTGENATHAYSTTGTFNATVFVNDSVGASANMTVSVLIVSTMGAVVCVRNVSAGACAMSTSTDVGITVDYNSTPIGGLEPYSYAWQFGDESGVSGPSVGNTTHSYAAPGTYTVEFWVNDSASHTYTTTLTVTVAALPSAMVRVAPNPVNVGSTVTFNSSVANGTKPFTYLWSFGDSSSAVTANATHLYSAAGTFTVTFVATDALGQIASGSVMVTVAATLAVSGSATPSVTEVGVPVAFTATVSGGAAPVALAWVFGDGGRATGASPSHTYAAEGTFSATVWANDSLGSSMHSTVSVTVNLRISAAATSSPASTDVGSTVTFSGVASGGVGTITYAWQFGDGTPGTGSSPTHVYTAPGTFVATLWANDSLAVSGTTTTSVTVAADPSVSSFSVSPGSVTSGTSVKFTVTIAGGTGPYSFVYSGLPSGCTTIDQATL
ncbi:MAG: PKD domain-containing protein, partial [Thermoplasmata archaeon]